MTIILDRIDTVVVQGNELTYELDRWLTTLSDALNSIIQAIEDALNVLVAPSLTTAQIVAAAVSAPDGSFWYATDSSPPNVVVKINGSLAQLTTTPFP